MQTDNSKVDLNVYLLKRGSDVAKAIKTKGLDTHELVFDGSHIGTLYAKAPHANPPRWARFFKDAIPITILGKNSATGALVIVETDGRIFAVAFGRGRHLLESEFIESNFGLRVTLNSVDENSLRSIDRASFEEHPRQSREQSGKAGQLQTFALEALLTADQDDKTAPIRFLVGLRGSLLLGGSRVEKRQHCMFLRHLYGLCSTAVHTGQLTTKYKKLGFTTYALQDGIELCARLIKKMMVAGSIPDWDDLQLGFGGPNLEIDAMEG